MTDKYGKKAGKSVYYAVEAKLEAKGMSTKHKPKSKGKK